MTINPVLVPVISVLYLVVSHINGIIHTDIMFKDVNVSLSPGKLQ